MSVLIPELFHILEQKSKEDGGLNNSWDGYATILCYLREVLQRLPSPEVLGACDTDSIDLLFGTELEHLAVLVVEIFPMGGFEELSTYLKTPTS